MPTVLPFDFLLVALFLFLLLSAKDGKDLPSPLLIIFLALALVLLMFSFPGLPLAFGSSLTTVSVRMSRLPSAFTLPVIINVGGPAT